MLGREDIGIDLGTATVEVFVKGKGIIIKEPAMVAIERNSRNIRAVGMDAKRMHGRTPPNILTMRPLRNGSVEDIEVTERMMRYFINSAVDRKIFVRPRVLVCVPSTLKEVEQRTISEVLLDAGARNAKILDSAVAGAKGAGLDISHSYGNMIVDIGGGLTDIAVIASEKVVVRSTVKVCGDSMDATIIRYLRRKHNLLIGERSAEELKLTIGAAVQRTERLSMDVTGRNLVSGLPKTIRIHSDEIQEAMEEQIQSLIEEIHAVLERTPPELAADVFDYGITLIGGGSQLFGLPEVLSQKLKVECRMTDNPEDAVALGIGKVLEGDDRDRISLSDTMNRKYRTA